MKNETERRFYRQGVEAALTAQQQLSDAGQPINLPRVLSLISARAQTLPVGWRDMFLRGARSTL